MWFFTNDPLSLSNLVVLLSITSRASDLSYLIRPRKRVLVAESPSDEVDSPVRSLFEER